MCEARSACRQRDGRPTEGRHEFAGSAHANKFARGPLATVYACGLLAPAARLLCMDHTHASARGEAPLSALSSAAAASGSRALRTLRELVAL